MAFQTYEITLLSIGLLPVVIAILAGLFLAGVYLLSKITREDQKFIGKSFAVVAGIVFIVMVFIGTVCMNIRPTEQFEDMHSVDPTETESQKLLAEEQTSIKALLSGIGAAELATCKLITRVDNFIKGDVGKPGLDDPTLVTQAQQRPVISPVVPFRPVLPRIVPILILSVPSMMPTIVWPVWRTRSIPLRGPS